MHHPAPHVQQCPSRPLLFERCWQKSPTDFDQPRTGLGLAIAQAVLKLPGIRIEAELRDGEVFTVILTVPPPI